MKLKKSHYSIVAVSTSLILLVCYAIGITRPNLIDISMLVLLAFNLLVSAVAAIPNSFFDNP
jgi:hypothetical protein